MLVNYVVFVPKKKGCVRIYTFGGIISHANKNENYHTMVLLL